MDFVEEQGVYIVANGTFNPAIFHPSWLAKNGIITSDEEESATIDVVHSDISRFQIPGLRFDVQQERVAIHASIQPFVRIADVFASIFGEKLRHSPMTSAGINFWVHFQLKSWEQRQKLGRLLAPVEPWGEFGKLMENSDKDLAGGFSTLAMRAHFGEYGESGAINVSVQPSTKVIGNSGVFTSVNSHFAHDEQNTEKLVSDIYNNFDSCLKRARGIVTEMISLGRSL